MHGSQLVLGRFRIDERVRPERDATTFGGVDLSTAHALIACVVEADVANACRGRRSKHHPALLPVIELARLTDVSPPMLNLPPSADALVLLEAPLGQSLDVRLARRGPLKALDAVRLLLPIVDALARLHDDGQVHGSVLPAAIEVSDNDERARLSLVGMSDHALAYRSPPRLINSAPSPYDDTWAVLCCLYEAVAGSPPYEAESPQALARRILGGKPLPLRAASPEHVDLQKIFDRVFARSSQQRFHKASALRDELEAFIRRHATAPAPPAPAQTVPDPARNELSSSTRRRTATWGDRRALFEEQVPSISHATLAATQGPSTTSTEPSRRTMAPSFGRQERDTDLGTGPALPPPEPAPASDTDVETNKRNAITSKGYLSRKHREEALLAAESAHFSASEPRTAAGLGPASLQEWQDAPTADVQQKQVDLAAAFEASFATAAAPELTAERTAILPQSAAPIDFDDWFDEPEPQSSRPTIPGMELTLDQLHEVSSRPTLVDPIERASHPDARPPEQAAPEETSLRARSEPPVTQAAPISSALIPVAMPPTPATPLATLQPLTDAPSVRQDIAGPPRSRSLFEGRTIAAFVAGVLLTAVAAFFLVRNVNAPASLEEAAMAPAAARPAAPTLAQAQAPAEAATPKATTESAAPSASTQAPVMARVQEDALSPLACLQRAFPEGTFSDKADGSFLCTESNARKGAGKLQTLIVEGGQSQGKVTEAMRAWSKLGWYELPTYAAMREQCCPQAGALELPRTSCSALGEVVTELGKATSAEALDEPVRRFGRAVSCVLEFHQEGFFGQSGHIAPASEETFRALITRARR